MRQITILLFKLTKLIFITLIVYSCGRKTISIIEKTDSDGKILKIKSEKYQELELHQSFYSNGMVEYEAEIKNGIPDGKVKYWNIEGKLVTYANYENGKLHGTSTRFYENGKFASKIEYFYGDIHGKYETYHENGKIKSNQIYEYGNPVTELLRFNRSGQRIYQP